MQLNGKRNRELITRMIRIYYNTGERVISSKKPQHCWCGLFLFKVSRYSHNHKCFFWWPVIHLDIKFAHDFYGSNQIQIFFPTDTI